MERETNDEVHYLTKWSEVGAKLGTETPPLFDLHSFTKYKEAIPIKYQIVQTVRISMARKQFDKTFITLADIYRL